MQVAECPLVDELRLWAVQRLLRKLRTFVTELTVHASCPAHACSPERCPGCSGSVPQRPVLPATLLIHKVLQRRRASSPEPHSGPGTGWEGASTHPQALRAQNTSPRPSVLLVISKTHTAPGLDSGHLCRRPQPQL